MRKQLLLAGFILTTYSPLHAQQPTANSVLNANPTPTHADSVQAVRSVFQKHRTGGWIWTGIGSAFALRIASVAVSSSSSGSFSSTTGGTVVGIGVLGGIPASIGISKLTRFSKSKEEQVIQLYDKAGILPPYVHRRLKARYFSR